MDRNLLDYLITEANAVEERGKNDFVSKVRELLNSGLCSAIELSTLLNIPTSTLRNVHLLKSCDIGLKEIALVDKLLEYNQRSRAYSGTINDGYINQPSQRQPNGRYTRQGRMVNSNARNGVYGYGGNVPSIPSPLFEYPENISQSRRYSQEDIDLTKQLMGYLQQNPMLAEKIMRKIR